MLRRTKNSVSQVSRDQLAALQESWGVVSHLSGMKLHQLPFRPSPSTQCHYTSCLSVFFSSYLPGLPLVDLPVFAALKAITVSVLTGYHAKHILEPFVIYWCHSPSHWVSFITSKTQGKQGSELAEASYPAKEEDSSTDQVPSNFGLRKW